MALLDMMAGAGSWAGSFLLAASVTLCVTAVALGLGALIGVLVAAAKLQHNLLLVALARGYTTVLRSVPELLVIYLIYFGGSNAVTAIAVALGYEGFVELSSFAAGALAVGLISGAYQAEVFRSAFLAIPNGELEAARAIGMRRMLRFRRIIVPQVFRLAIPGIGNVWQLSLKDSALVSVTGLVELMRISQVAAGSTRNYVLFFSVGGCLYLILSVLSNRIFAIAEKRANRTMPSAFHHG